MTAEGPRAGEDWQRDEIDLLLQAYFDLMAAEQAGLRPVKADLNRELQRRLPVRTRGSIEYKLQNVSATLNDLGLPWIDGYKPARNYQAALRERTTSWLARHPAVSESLAAYGDEAPPLPHVSPLEEVLVPPPAGGAGSKRTGQLHLSRGDWGALRDARNRELGRLGEEWVVELERAELRARGRDDLALGVDWVSQSRGDGLGYDVASFTEDGDPKAIEVKTTNLGPRAPFYLTRRELAVSAEVPAQYRLYRVFEFAREPRLFIVSGALDHQVILEPLLYHARVG